MYRLLAFALVALTASYPLAALACSCVPNPPPKEALAKSRAVFTGKVLDVERVAAQNKVTIEVLLVWKGIKEAKVVLYTPVSGAACGVSFEKDKKYIVYCSPAKDNVAPLQASLCSRTAPLESAKDDLQDLGLGEAPGAK